MARDKRRSRLRIIADVLSVTENGAKKTHIMYQANLSHKLLTFYLDKVLEAELIRFTEESSYEITQKGMRFLERFYSYSQRREDVKDVKSLLENMV